MIFQSLLNKLFRVREDSAQRFAGRGADDGYDGAEMPFLDHLEDLRTMLFRIIVTLMIAMIACFTVNDKLIDWIRLPMQWANIGGGGPAFFVSKAKKKAAEEEMAIKEGNWVVTRGGFVGRVANIDDKARLTEITIGNPPQVAYQSSEIVGKLPRPAPEPDPEPMPEPEPEPEAEAESKPASEETLDAEPAEAEQPQSAEPEGDAPPADPVANKLLDLQIADEAPKEDTGAKIRPGDRVTTSSGVIGKVVAIDETAQTTTLEIGQAPTVLLRSSAIVTKLHQRDDIPESEKNPDDPRSLIANQNFLIMEVFQPYEALVLTLKLAFFAGLVLSFPLVMFFVAQFVLPGLRQVEKKVVFPSLGVGFVLFLVGATFAFCVGLPLALDFLAQYTLERRIEPGWRIGYYIKFVTQVTLVFGLAFELPVVVMALVKLDLLTYRTMRDSRAYAIVILMVLSAFLTPPDPMTLMLLSVPLVLLYEVCIWLAYMLERKQLRQEAEEESRRAAERAEREKRREELREKIEAGEELSEEEKRQAAASEIEHYESNLTDDDQHALETHEDDPHHHDEHADDPHHHDHDWDHDYQHDDDYHHHHGHTPTMIDINNATVEELQNLPGVGPKLAERIIEARPIYSEDELEYHAHLPQSVIKLILDRIFYG